MKVLILGANGLIGSSLLKHIADRNEHELLGTVRDVTVANGLPLKFRNKVIPGIDALCKSTLLNLYKSYKPDVVINCVGITKHTEKAFTKQQIIKTNSVLPHFLSSISADFEARLIHISTDCVFSGKIGGYDEEQVPDCADLYGKSKALGELLEPRDTIIRTSSIGHEWNTKYGLLEWFLSQKKRCFGFTHAIFSGLTSNLLAQTITDLVLPNHSLAGLYNVGSEPISKYDLLKLIADVYGHNVDVLPKDELKINRSLDFSKFAASTGYIATGWRAQIENMRDLGR